MAYLPPTSHIRLLKTFDAAASRGFAEERIAAYLLNCGYRQGEGADGLEFSRGRGATTPMELSPRGWRVVVRVTVSEQGPTVKVRALFTINVTGQTPSRCGNAFWLAELNGLEEAVSTGDVSARRSRRMAWLALLSNAVLAVVVLSLVGGGGTLGAYLAEKSQAGASGVVLVVGGAALGFGLAYLTARYVFGLFASTTGLPFAPEEDEETGDG